MLTKHIIQASSTREKKHAIFLKYCTFKKMHVFFSRVDEALVYHEWKYVAAQHQYNWIVKVNSVNSTQVRGK